MHNKGVKMKLLRNIVIILCGLMLMKTMYAADIDAAPTVKVLMYNTAAKGRGSFVGSINIQESANGLMFKLHLFGLTPGEHGFHLHQNPSCAANGMAAGGHFDPKNTNKHLGPYGNGHLGDLPVILVAADGTATQTITAPHLHSLSDIDGLSLMIHEDGDNYSDTPKSLGGGGGRMVCGLIPA